MTQLSYFALPILKAERGSDGALVVYGKATDGTVDLDDQIVDPEFARRALKEWHRDWGNVRQMHSGQLPPAGIALELEDQADGQWLRSRVYEPGAVKQVEEGGYKAYSVGIARPRVVRDALAPNGRIVDGTIVEVSLVDRPANPSCKFAITKGAGADMEVVAKNVDIEPGPAPEAAVVVPDPQEAEKAARKAAKKAASVESGKWYELAKRDMDPNVGGGVDRDKIPAEDFAGPDRSFPIVTPGDVADAAQSLGRAPAAKRDEIKAKIISIAQRKGPKFVAQLPDTWTSDASDKAAVPAPEAAKAPAPEVQPPPRPGDVPYPVRRLHDLCCAAYPTTAVKDAYPVIEKNGVATALGPGAKLALWQMLAQEVQEDGGSGSESADIHHVAEAFKCLCDFLADEEAEDGGDSAGIVLLAARDRLHEEFRRVNKDLMADGAGPSIPPATGQITPGQFRRPYLAAGHQRENGTGASDPGIPDPTHVISPDDYQRGPLTAGQERQSPGNSGKRAPVDAVSLLHDHLACLFPSLCPMELPSVSTIPNRDAARPAPVKAAQSAIRKSDDRMCPSCGYEVDDDDAYCSHCGEKIPAVEGGDGGDEDGEKAARTPKKSKGSKRTPEAKAAKRTKAAERKAARRARLEKLVAKTAEPHLAKIAELEREVRELGKQPDVNQAAHRGTAIVTKAAEVAEAQRRAADAERERLGLLEWNATHAADPRDRLRFQDQLATARKAAAAGS